MRTKHTEGRWRVHDKGGSYRILTDKLSICDIFQDYPDNSVDKANAYLIAAAPDLLTACEGILGLLNADLDAVSNWQPEAQAVRDAITRAKGGA